jgi:hypothetical protein
VSITPWLVHRPNDVLEVPAATIRDALLHAADLVANDGWEPWPGGVALGGPRNLHVLIGDACRAFQVKAGEVQLWMAAHAAVSAIIKSDLATDPDVLPRSLDEFEWRHDRTAEDIAELVRRAARLVDPSPPRDDE